MKLTRREMTAIAQIANGIECTDQEAIHSLYARGLITNRLVLVVEEIVVLPVIEVREIPVEHIFIEGVA